jgi:hypothetical protein
MRRAFAVTLVLFALTGCQGTFPAMNGLSQPGRVPPPPTGSYQVPGTYSSTANPLVDQVAAAQNQLKQATDEARAAVIQSTQNLQGQVEQAATRADRIGAGVVQASQVLSDAATGPLSSGPLSSGSSAPASSGSSAPPAIATDPNAQWRTPRPR